MELWNWGLIGGLAGLVVYQQWRLFHLWRQAKKREELFQIIAENAADMIALVDIKGRRLYNSPAYKRVLGYSPAELSETSAFEQIHPDDRFRVLEAGREARSTGIGRDLEYRMRHKDGSWRIFESRASALRDENGQVAKLVIVNRDVTARRRAEEQIEHNAFHDVLTGLPNRRLFLDRLEGLFARRQRDCEREYALLLADLDGFKFFNETRGNAAGDRALVEIGQRIAACLRQADTISRPEAGAQDTVLSRLGGDEFTVLLDGVGDPSDAMRVAQRIQNAIAEPVVIEQQAISITASVGIALRTASKEPLGGEEFRGMGGGELRGTQLRATELRAEDILREAETAMRRAKALGGSRAEVFDEAMHSRAVRRLTLEAELLRALERQEFRVLYLPVVHLETRRILGFEALLRWQHPEQGLISPYSFLVAAEDTGLMVRIGSWELSEACRALARWQLEGIAGEMGGRANAGTDPGANAGRNATLTATQFSSIYLRPISPRPIFLSMNISARQLRDAHLTGSLEAALGEAGVAPARLQFEIAESIAAADPKLAAAALHRLKQLGVGVILDDFGTGRSSLLDLRRLPLEAVKIDRSLIAEMLSDRAADDVIAIILALGRRLNLGVIAEGIENMRQLEHLRERGCALGQGYVFSQPVDAEGAAELLRKQAERPLAVALR